MRVLILTLGMLLLTACSATMEKSLEELVKNGKIDQSAARSGH